MNIKRSGWACFLALHILVISCYVYAWEYSAGTDGMDFLKIKIASRQQGMGSAAVGVCDDINTIQYNPAGLVVLDDQEFVLGSALMFFPGLYFNHLGYQQIGSKKRGATSFSMSLFSLPITELDIQGRGLGSIKTESIIWQVTHSRKVYRRWYVGADVKVITFAVGDISILTYSFDAGALYRTPIRGLNLGLAVENIAPKYKMEHAETSEFLGIGWRFGLAKKLTRMNLLLAFDVVKRYNSKLKWNIGAEYNVKNLIFLRGGYKMGYDLESYSLGCGFRQKIRGFDEFGLNFAYVPMGELGYIQYISFDSKF